jgi:hypothetical protein
MLGLAKYKLRIFATAVFGGVTAIKTATIIKVELFLYLLLSIFISSMSKKIIRSDFSTFYFERQFISILNISKARFNELIYSDIILTYLLSRLILYIR